MEVRLAKLIKLRIDKEADPENRRISVELVNPEDTYKVDSTRTDKAGVYSVDSQLKQAGKQLSSLESKFDSNNNDLTVILNKKYKLTLGVYDETLANLVLTNTQEKKNLAEGTLRTYDESNIDYVELHLKWNRFWSAMQKEILNNQNQNELAKTNTQFNSYFGDVLSQLSQDLKKPYDAINDERALVKKDLGQLLLILGDFYSNFIPEDQRGQIKSHIEAMMAAKKQEDDAMKAQPFHKRVYLKYNKLADKLNEMHLRVRSMSKRLARFVPKLPKVAYVNGKGDASKKFDNDLTVTRITHNAKNLYQANSIYRDNLRKLAKKFLDIKGNLARRSRSFSIKALVNKYKYKPLDSYTIVGMVYNRRNVLRFNGNAKILKAQCSYLLTHELTKNQFSVILNNNDKDGILSVSAYGQPAIEINAENAFINNKKISFPYKYENKEKLVKLVVKKIFNGVSLEIENELLVECYQDSKACIVALTRFSTGKVNGLLGRSNQDGENKDEDHWYVDKSCKLPNVQLKAPSTEAIKTCYSAYGRHRKSLFKKAYGVIH